MNKYSYQTTEISKYDSYKYNNISKIKDSSLVSKI